MEPNFTDLPLNQAQSALVADASRLQDVGARQIKTLQRIVFNLEELLKKRQLQVKGLEIEINDIQQQIAALIPTQSAYEKAAEVIMREFRIEPPYQASLVYDKGKPLAIRIINKVQSTSTVPPAPPTTSVS